MAKDEKKDEPVEKKGPKQLTPEQVAAKRKKKREAPKVDLNTDQAARKKMLLATYGRRDYPKCLKLEQAIQLEFELKAMKDKCWEPGIKASRRIKTIEGVQLGH